MISLVSRSSLSPGSLFRRSLKQMWLTTEISESESPGFLAFLALWWCGCWRLCGESAGCEEVEVLLMNVLFR